MLLGGPNRGTRTATVLFIVRQPDGNEIGVHAEKLCVTANGAGSFRFEGPEGVFLELPALNVESVRLVDVVTDPARERADEESL